MRSIFYRLFAKKVRFCISGGKKNCPLADAGPVGAAERKRHRDLDLRGIARQTGIMLALLFAATVFAYAVSVYDSHCESVVMIYLLAVMLSTVWTKGFAYGIAASLISKLLVNFYFTEPKYTFVMLHTTDLIPFATFAVTALVTGTVMTHLRREKDAAQRNEGTARLLYEVSAGFVHATGRSGIALKGIAYIRDHAGLECAVELAAEEVYRSPGDTRPLGVTAGHTILPIPGVWKTLGRLHVYASGSDMSLKQELVAKTVAAQMGVILERETIYNERENIRIAMESEKLRSTLLRAIAHDLRSPLTAISGDSALLADKYDTLTDDERKKLAGDISEEMVWLTNLAENILNMTRINESRLVIKREEEVVDDVVGGAVSHISRLLQGRLFKVTLPDEVVTLPMDAILVAQVIVNLLDNAARHTPPGTPVSLRVYADPDDVTFEVEDGGEGIDPSIRGTLFDGFTTLQKRVLDGKRGIGLGLAICKAVVEGHGGTISAMDAPGGGALFQFKLPRRLE